MTENGVLISLKNVSVFYDGKAVISGVSRRTFSAARYSVFSAKAAGGKTTLLNILSGLVSPDEGEITYAGDAAPRCSYVFQEASLLPNLTALKNLTFAGGEKTYCEKLLARAGLADKENKRPPALSGGEKQRVALMRAFAAPFDLLLADEPFSALDIALREKIIALFASLLDEKSAAEGAKTAVFVTHSVKEALALADRVAVLRGGKFVKTIRVKDEDYEKTRAELIAALTEE